MNSLAIQALNEMLLKRVKSLYKRGKMQLSKLEGDDFEYLAFDLNLVEIEITFFENKVKNCNVTADDLTSLSLELMECAESLITRRLCNDLIDAHLDILELREFYKD